MNDEATSLPSPGGSRPKDQARARAAGMLEATRPYRTVLVLTVAVAVVVSLTQANFLTSANIQNLLTGVSVLWVISLGMTFVVLTGGVDLSVGAMVALTGIFLAKLLGLGVPDILAVLLSIGFGAVVGGAINGTLIGWFGLSFFVITLASATALTGAVNLWSHTQTTFITSSLIGNIGNGKILGVNTPIWIMIVTFLIALYVQRLTYFGRDLYAVGGSLQAARLSGIRTSRTLIVAYAVTGACAGVGAIIQVGQLGASSPQVGAELPLQAAAAVLLGGTLLTGGSGGVTGSAIGVLFIGVLQNGLSISGVSSFWQEVVTGVILVTAVFARRTTQPGSLTVVIRRLWSRSSTSQTSQP